VNVSSRSLKTNRENITTFAKVSQLEIGKLAAHRKRRMQEIFDIKLENLHVKTSLLHGGNGETHVAKFRREIYDDM